MNPSVRTRRPVYTDRLGQRRHRPDYWLLLLMTILLATGLIVLYAISPGLASQKGVGENYFVVKQLMAIGVGLVAFLLLANVPLRNLRKLTKPLIIASLFAAVAVRIFGEQVNGAYRWIQVGGFS